MIKDIINVYRMVQGLDSGKPLSLNQTAERFDVPRSTFKDAMASNSFNDDVVTKVAAGLRTDPATLKATQSSDKKVRDTALNFVKKGLILATWKTAK